MSNITFTLCTENKLSIHNDYLCIINENDSLYCSMEGSGFEKNCLWGDRLLLFFQKVSQSAEQMLASVNGKETPRDAERNPILITTQIEELAALSQILPKITQIVLRDFPIHFAHLNSEAYFNNYNPIKLFCNNFEQLCNKMQETAEHLQEQVFYKENRPAITDLLNSLMPTVQSTITLSYLTD